MRRIRRWGAVALVAMLGSGAGTAPAATAAASGAAVPRRGITVTRLVDDQGRPLVQPHQLNERGQVLAAIEGPQLGWARYFHHALWERGRATLIEVPSTPLPPGLAAEIMTMPFEVSERGHVVGMRTHLPYYPIWAFLWVDGEYTPLVPESADAIPPNPGFVATDVNERGETLGIEVAARPDRPFEIDLTAGVRDADGTVLARSDVDAYPVDLDNRGRALLDVVTDPATLARRAGVWDIRRNQVTDLGTLGGATSRGLAMNVQGHVAGVSTTAAGDEHAFLWTGGGRALRDLGTLGGANSGVGDGGIVLPNHDREESALNAWGHVVGWAETAGGAEHAVLWRDGRTVDLGTLGGADSRAAAINEWGQVVGWAETATGARHAFLWQDGRMTDLGALDPTAPAGASSAAVDVNNRGQVLGTSGPGAVVWSTLPFG